MLNDDQKKKLDQLEQDLHAGMHGNPTRHLSIESAGVRVWRVCLRPSLLRPSLLRPSLNVGRARGTTPGSLRMGAPDLVAPRNSRSLRYALRSG